jgi:tetratricopeptide (TPR) repeat protein
MLAENGEYEHALQQFEAIHRASRSFSPAWNNHGNVEVMLGRFNRAQALYDSALAHHRYSRGTYLNLAILYQLMIDGAPKDSANYYQRKSEAALLQAAQYLEGEVEAAYALLGIQEDNIESKAGPVDWVKARVRKARKFVDTAFRMYVQKKEIRNVPLDRHGPKGRNEVDADRGMTLYWSF